MAGQKRTLSVKAPLVAALALLAMSLSFAGQAGAMYPIDGTKPDGSGGYMNPSDGMCVIGVKADGTMLVDWSITNFRDCVAYTTGLTGMTTQAKCEVADGIAPNDGYKHKWATSNVCINAAAPTVAISLVDLDRTTAMCTSKGGTTLTAATCTAYGWVYRNRKTADNSLPVSGVGVTTTDGVQSTDDLGFCYTTIDMTSATYASRSTCPSAHNNNPPGIAPGGEWGACSSNTVLGCQTQASYDAGLGWTWPDTTSVNVSTGAVSSTAIKVCKDSAYTIATCPADVNHYWNTDISACVDVTKTTGTSPTCTGGTLSSVTWIGDPTNPRCLYAYGTKGKLGTYVHQAGASALTPPGGVVDLTTITNQGDCLAGGYSWENWLPNINRTTKTNASGGDYTGMPAGAELVKLDATTLVKDGGGNFWANTGAICTRCHTDQSRGYMERYKPGFIETRHKLAGDAVGEPFQPFFTAASSDWGLKGVVCGMCHSTARAAQDDLIQVVGAGVAAGVPGPPGAGAPKSATGHNNTRYGSQVTTVCFHCHGTPAVPSTTNPASVIPVAAGDFALTTKGLAPIANQFLNSPHAEYSGDSTKVDIGNKSKYASTYVGYVCRSSSTAFGAGSILTTVYRSGVAMKIPNADTTTNTYCTNTGDGSATSGAATSPGVGAFWVKEGEAVSGGTPTDTAQGNCMTCHDVHWALSSTDLEAEPLRKECTTCHSHPTGEASASSAPQIDLTKINHLSGPGTPLENMATEPSEPCEICHMPESSATGSRMHLWRINTDSTYVTMGGTQANLAADGTYTNAAWVDLDHACGQCHGGSGPGPDFTTAYLATVAEGMHADAGVNYPVTFSYSVAPNTLNVTVTASVDCGAGGCPVFTYDWNWGEVPAVPNGSGNPSTHTYPTAGTKTIMLTVNLSGLSVGTATRSFTIAAPDLAPTAAGVCTWNADTWVMSVTDTSSDDGPDGDTTPPDGNATLQIVMDWGDGTTKSFGAQGVTLNHTYNVTGGFPVSKTAIDSKLQSASMLCAAAATPSYFTISGTVKNKLPGTKNLASATVQVRRNGTLVKTVYTATNGTFSATNLKPGAYTLTVAKSGYTFAVPALTIPAVGPSSAGNIIYATGP